MIRLILFRGEGSSASSGRSPQWIAKLLIAAIQGSMVPCQFPPLKIVSAV